jgi:hypothetical protein
LRNDPFPLNNLGTDGRKNNEIEDEGEVNTSRNLKTDNMDRRVTCDPLTLKENLDRMESLEHHRVEEGDNVNKIVPDVYICNNNFVDRKNMTQEITTGDKCAYENELRVTEGRPKTHHEITLMDYESLPFHERLYYDKRSFTRYLVDNLIRRTLVISIPLKHSYLDPVYIRIAKLILGISLVFGLNAVLVDLYIEKQAISSRVIHISYI